MIETIIDQELYDLLISIDDKDKLFIRGIFLYCESQEDRKKLIDYINNGHTDRKEVILMATMIGIESGNVEGELIEEE